MRDEAGRGSSMPYISAFSREGAALMTLGTTTSPSETAEAEAWRSRRAARRRGVGMEEAVGEALQESVLRFLAIRARGRASAPVQVPYRQEPSRQARRPLAAAAVALAFVRAVLGGTARAEGSTATAELAQARPGACWTERFGRLAILGSW
jgi:hypothetical protein